LLRFVARAECLAGGCARLANQEQRTANFLDYVIGYGKRAPATENRMQRRFLTYYRLAMHEDEAQLEGWRPSSCLRRPVRPPSRTGTGADSLGGKQPIQGPTCATSMTRGPASGYLHCIDFDGVLVLAQGTRSALQYHTASKSQSPWLHYLPLRSGRDDDLRCRLVFSHCPVWVPLAREFLPLFKKYFPGHVSKQFTRETPFLRAMVQKTLPR
jgi:hypothetical protein